MKIFVIGSYNGTSQSKIKQNINKANKAGMEILKKGHLPLVPQSMFASWEKEVDMKKIMKTCFEWIKACDAVLVLNVGSKGGGTWSALEVAKKNSKKIFYATEDIPSLD